MISGNAVDDVENAVFGPGRLGGESPACACSYRVANRDGGTVYKNAQQTVPVEAAVVNGGAVRENLQTVQILTDGSIYDESRAIAGI